MAGTLAPVEERLKLNYMTVTMKHKVFISFQHGCEDTVHPCGKNEILLPWKKVPNFTDCQGYCGRNKESIYHSHSKCRYYYQCGHYWKERFEHLMTTKTNKIISKAVGDGDIQDGIKTETTRQKIRDEYIADASVTVVLIGPETWKRKHVDWEISSSIKSTKNNPRCGLIGLFLPTHPDHGKDKFSPYIIPPRLYYNKKIGFAEVYDWNENTDYIQQWIHTAYLRRDNYEIDNSYPMFGKNRPDHQNHWQP